MWHSLRRIPMLIAICATPWRPVAAQASHADVLGDMAARCLIPAVASADSFRVAFDNAPAFIETALLRIWIDEGRTVKAADVVSDGATGERLLRVSVDEAVVRLDRAGRGMLERSAEVAVAYRFTASSGIVLAADTCRATDVDTFDADLAPLLADDGHPGTSPDIPEGSGLRRIIEPVVVTGAAAVGTWLFFNLRSRRSDN